MKTLLFTFSVLLVSSFAGRDADLIYSIENANVTFVSDAPLENIMASSTDVKGLINFSDNTFAIFVEMNSFNGFNSQLQKEHFNENYVESIEFPKAIYKGKIIEPININQNGKFNIRSKGNLEIHGITKEHIIPVTLRVEGSMIFIEADFSVNLGDYEISIPRIVSQKISKNIKVSINAKMSLYQSAEN